MNTTPCMLNPAGWDLDDVGQGVRAALVPDAVAACEVCPLRGPCRVVAEADPPRHACVWGGLVYDGRGQPGITLDEWLVANPLPATFDCPGCGVTVTTSYSFRKYCTRRCYDRVAQRRRRALAAANRERRNLPAEVRAEQVRQLLGEGLAVEDIAARLNLGVRSVRNYRRAVAA